MTTCEGDRCAIVGRDTELDVIDALLEHTARAGSGALLLAGEPGVGKTMLLDAAAAAASAGGREVARATGVEFDTEVSFGALSQMLNGMHDEFHGVGTPYRDALRVVLGLGAGPTPNPLLVGNALLAVLERIAARRPVLVIADDLQWFDQASFDTVMFAARRITDSAVRFLGATRTGSGFDGEPGTTGPPRVGAAGRRRRQNCSDPDSRGSTGPTRQRLLVGAQGNPLALLELAGAVQDGRWWPDDSADGTPLSQRLRTIYAARIRALPAATREVLLLAALHGAGEAAVLQAAATGDALVALAPAEHDRLISVDETSGRVVFRHPVIRSTVVELARDIERRRAHYALADALIDNRNGGPGISPMPPSNPTRRSRTCSSAPRTRFCAKAIRSARPPRWPDPVSCRLTCWTAAVGSSRRRHCAPRSPGSCAAHRNCSDRPFESSPSSRTHCWLRSRRRSF